MTQMETALFMCTEGDLGVPQEVEVEIEVSEVTNVEIEVSEENCEYKQPARCSNKSYAWHKQDKKQMLDL